jgi:hypothetical protein
MIRNIKYWNTSEKIKPVKIKPIKEKKEKKIKEKIIKEKEEPKELTDEEFVKTIIDEYEKQLKIHYENISNINKIIMNLKTKTDKEIVLNERRKLISKYMSKIPSKDPSNDEEKEKKEKITNNIKNNIALYDKYFNITHDDLENFDYK